MHHNILEMNKFQEKSNLNWKARSLHIPGFTTGKKVLYSFKNTDFRAFFNRKNKSLNHQHVQEEVFLKIEKLWYPNVRLLQESPVMEVKPLQEKHCMSLLLSCSVTTRNHRKIHLPESSSS